MSCSLRHHPASRFRSRPALLALEDRTAPAVLTVTTLADSGPGSLRDTLAAASAGDTVQFDAGLNGGTIDLTGGTLTINKDLTVRGPGSGNLTVRRDDGAAAFRIFTVTTPFTTPIAVSLSGLTVANGYGVGDFGQGGGLSNSSASTLVLGDVVFDSNRDDFEGGAVENIGTMTLLGCGFRDNSAVYGAGIINGYGAPLSVVGCSFFQNVTTTTGYGGGIDNNGNLTVADSGFYGNYAADGAGVFNSGTMTASGSTFAYNSGWSGAGVLSFGGTLAATNCTFYGNVAASFDGGGLELSGTASLVNCTITANQAEAFFGGGGIAVRSGTTTMLNTLVADNYGANGSSYVTDDIRGAVDASSGYNLIGDGTGLTGISDGGNGNQIGTAANPIDPGLSFLNFNGGPTPTVALLAYSPAIGAGTSVGAPAVDQRGEARPTPPSIGASEYVASVAVAFQVIGPASATVGVPVTLTVTAVDAYGNPVTDYLGTVHFSSSDPLAVLPSDTTFTGSGSESFTVVFGTDGGTPQTVTVSDGTLTGSATVIV